MDEKRRPWFRFRLPALLVLVAMLAVLLSWVADLLNLIHAKPSAERPLGSERSPDGALVAEYSWRPTLFDIGDTSPMLYLTIRDARTGAVVSRHEYWGDGASLYEAQSAFRSKLPW
jgi:hypothetical protein